MLARIVNSMPFGLSHQITKLYFQVLLRNQREAHSIQRHYNCKDMEISVIPALQDNYMYLITDKATNKAGVVDPVEPEAVLKVVQERGVTLTCILTTHHHWDHAGGNEQLVKLHPELIVYGGDDRVEALTEKVENNTTFSIGQLDVKCLFTPGHTLGHICYFVTSPVVDTVPVVFTGDTLFVAGCGRLFEGTAKEMYEALVNVLSNLPDHTRVFCGHEYTIQNLMFALLVEPSNEEIKKKLDSCQKIRQEGKPTVPSTIGEEKLYNPFMRVFVESVMQYAKKTDAIETMRVIRKQKDTYRA